MRIRNLHSRLFIAAITFIVVFTACEPDESFDDPRERIEGEWICTEESEIYDNPPYTVYISPDPIDSSLIIISNFYNLGTYAEASARLIGNSITFPNQAISDASSNNWWIKSGSGRVSSSSDNITLSYAIDDGSGQIDNVSAEYERK